ncbi:hypothetical protein ACOSQ2_030854 [Xanthoceras sorbifolium]
MLEAVTRLNVKFGDKKVGVPKQVVVSDSETLRNEMWEIANSHQLWLVLDEEGLQSLATPIVLQEFISDMNSSDYNKNEDGFGVEVDLERVEMPSECLELRLNLFNFDVIKDAKDGSRYLVIDVNYFPRYAKMLKHHFKNVKWRHYYF